MRDWARRVTAAVLAAVLLACTAAKTLSAAGPATGAPALAAAASTRGSHAPAPAHHGRRRPRKLRLSAALAEPDGRAATLSARPAAGDAPLRVTDVALDPPEHPPA